MGCGSAAGGRRKRRGRRAEAPAARSPPTGSPNEKGPAHGDGALSRNPSSPPGDGLEKEKWRSKKPRRPWRRVRVHGPDLRAQEREAVRLEHRARDAATAKGGDRENRTSVGRPPPVEPRVARWATERSQCGIFTVYRG